MTIKLCLESGATIVCKVEVGQSVLLSCRSFRSSFTFVWGPFGSITIVLAKCFVMSCFNVSVGNKIVSCPSSADELKSL